MGGCVFETKTREQVLSWGAQKICKRGRLDEEGKKSDNFWKKLIDKTLKMSKNNTNIGCGCQQNPYFALRLTVEVGICYQNS